MIGVGKSFCFLPHLMPTHIRVSRPKEQKHSFLSQFQDFLAMSESDENLGEWKQNVPANENYFQGGKHRRNQGFLPEDLKYMRNELNEELLDAFGYELL